MPRFVSVFEAFQWAETILSVREGGRSNAAMMEMLWNGGIPKDYDLLDAIEIRNAAFRACKAGHPCPCERVRCLFHWHLPDPLIEYPRMSQDQERRIMECDAKFKVLLQEKGFLER